MTRLALVLLALVASGHKYLPLHLKTSCPSRIPFAPLRSQCRVRPKHQSLYPTSNPREPEPMEYSAAKAKVQSEGNYAMASAASARTHRSGVPLLGLYIALCG